MRACDRSATAPPRRDGRPQSRGPLAGGGERHQPALLGPGLRTPLVPMRRSTGRQASRRPAVCGNGGALDRKRPEDAGIDASRVKPVDGGRRRELPSV
jgi:hypothetical protein